MNPASMLLAAMYGFTGLRPSDSDWRLFPASLPEGWKKIEIDRMWISGQPMPATTEGDLE